MLPVSGVYKFQLPYRQKFLGGAKFRYFRGPV